jgi:hypothetical protein
MHGLAIATVALTLASPASTVLTKPQYQALLTQADARVEGSESAAVKIAFARHASHANAAGALERWAAAEATNAHILGAATPPAPTRAANKLLVRAERMQADDLRTLARIVRATPGTGNVQRIAQRTMTPRAGKLLDRAIVLLHKLGYR